MIASITWGRDFRGIVRYLIDHRAHEVLDLSGVSSIGMAATEMAFVARQSERATSVVAHVSLAAALEDGQLDRATWLTSVVAVEAELGLEGHQRVVVRHSDKTHDHVHAFWCTVSPDTFVTPPKRWFLAKGAAVPDIGPRALTPAQVESVPAEQRKRGSWNKHALLRLQRVCRGLEERLNLRRLRAASQVAQSRERGEPRPATDQASRRNERTGSRPLMDRAIAIRSALDRPTWTDAQGGLARIGLGLEPAFRPRKGADPVISGLIIHDLTDPSNRMPASRFDLPGLKYGLRQIEKRHDVGAPTMEVWWPTRDAFPAVADPRDMDPFRADREDYHFERQRHRLVEADKAAARHALRDRQKRERATLVAVLKERRRAEAMALPAADRRGFYTAYALTVRAPVLAELARRHREEVSGLRRARTPTWAEYRAARTKTVASRTRLLAVEVSGRETGRQTSRLTVKVERSLQKAREAAVDAVVAALFRDDDDGRPDGHLAPLLRRSVATIAEHVGAGWMSLRLDGDHVVASSVMTESMVPLDAIEDSPETYRVLRAMAKAIADFGGGTDDRRYVRTIGPRSHEEHAPVSAWHGRRRRNGMGED